MIERITNQQSSIQGLSLVNWGLLYLSNKPRLNYYSAGVVDYIISFELRKNGMFQKIVYISQHLKHARIFSYIFLLENQYAQNNEERTS